MAGMPQSVVARAESILKNLEQVYGNNEIVPSGDLKHRSKKRHNIKEEVIEAAGSNIQLSMFQLDGLDIDSLTPIEALNKLNEIKKITGL